MVGVTIIGPGRVGGALAKYRIDHMIGRTRARESETSGNTGEVTIDARTSTGSEIIFITTQDGNVQAAALALSGKVRPGTFVFHTSGALTSSILNNLIKDGCHVGSIHPLVSISSSELGPNRFPGAYFCVEGSPAAVIRAREIVTDLQGRPFEVATKFKTLYHAAAVMACGHLVALFDSAVEVLTKCGLEQNMSKEILLPLVMSTVSNLELQPTSSALTGTFGRADIDTFTRHLTSLNENVADDILEIYLLLGERSLELAAKEGVNPDRIDSLRAKMSVAKSRLKW